MIQPNDLSGFNVTKDLRDHVFNAVFSLGMLYIGGLPSVLVETAYQEAGAAYHQQKAAEAYSRTAQHSEQTLGLSRSKTEVYHHEQRGSGREKILKHLHKMSD